MLPSEEAMLRVLEDVSGVRAESTEVQLVDGLGMDSLGFAELVVALEDFCTVEPEEVAACVTIGDLHKLIVTNSISNSTFGGTQ